MLAVMALIFVTACTSTNCRRKKENQAPLPIEQIEKEPFKDHSKSKQDSAFVFKYDGSLQCGMGQKISAKEMAKQLTRKNIPVISSQNKPDGLMHIQVCGSPTGQANVYEIPAAKLEEAQKLGFKPWTFN